MATAKRLPSGNYRVRAYIGTDADGKKLYKSFTAKTKKQAERDAIDYLDKHVGPAGVVTFKTAEEMFFAQRGPVLSPSTRRGYTSIRNELENRHERFCNTELELLKSADIQQIINDLVMRGRTPKTVKNYIGYISAIFSFLDTPLPKVKMPEKVQQEIYIPDEATIKEILLLSKGSELEIPILLAITVPARRGEICGLEMSDLDGDTIHIHRSVVEDEEWEWHTKAPKTFTSDRYVTIPHKVAELIRQQGYVTNLTPDEISAKFRWLLKSNGLKHFRFHDLRHFGCSMMHLMGIPDQYILERGGWSTDNVMKQIYRHTITEGRNMTNKAIEANFGKLF